MINAQEAKKMFKPDPSSADFNTFLSLCMNQIENIIKKNAEKRKDITVSIAEIVDEVNYTNNKFYVPKYERIALSTYLDGLKDAIIQELNNFGYKVSYQEEEDEGFTTNIKLEISWDG